MRVVQCVKNHVARNQKNVRVFFLNSVLTALEMESRDDLLNQLAEIFAKEQEAANEDGLEPGASPVRKRCRSKTPDVEDESDSDSGSESDSEDSDDEDGYGDAVAREIMLYLADRNSSKKRKLKDARLAACAYIVSCK